MFKWLKNEEIPNSDLSRPSANRPIWAAALIRPRFERDYRDVEDF